jgi:hypothetical protein
MIAGPDKQLILQVEGFISVLNQCRVTAITADLTTVLYCPVGKSFVLLSTNDRYNQSLLINNSNPNPNVESSFPTDRQLGCWDYNKLSM